MAWVFFVIVLLGDGKVEITPYGLWDSEAACQHGQADVVLAHGQELLTITPCLRVPKREKL